MPYGRSQIAPYYLNTIAKARAEQEMLDKRIKAERDAAAKDRWFRAGMGALDIGAQFGMQAYADHLKQKRAEFEIAGHPDFYAPEKAEPIAAPAAAPPVAPPPTARRPAAEAIRPKGPAPRTTLAAPDFTSEEPEEAPDVPVPYPVPYPEPIPEPEPGPEPTPGGPTQPAAPKTGADEARKNPMSASPKMSSDSPLLKWRKDFDEWTRKGGEFPGLPPEKLESKDQHQAGGYLWTDGKRYSEAEFRKMHPDEKRYYKAVVTSKVLERNSMDMALKRAQIENLEYERQMRPAKWFKEALDIQTRVKTNTLNYHAGKNQYIQVMIQAQKYSEGQIVKVRGQKPRRVYPKYVVKLEGNHPLWPDVPNMYWTERGKKDKPKTDSGSPTGRPTSRTKPKPGARVKDPGQYPDGTLPPSVALYSRSSYGPQGNKKRPQATFHSRLTVKGLKNLYNAVFRTKNPIELGQAGEAHFTTEYRQIMSGAYGQPGTPGFYKATARLAGKLSDFNQAQSDKMRNPRQAAAAKEKAAGAKSSAQGRLRAIRTKYGIAINNINKNEVMFGKRTSFVVRITGAKETVTRGDIKAYIADKTLPDITGDIGKAVHARIKAEAKIAKDNLTRKEDAILQGHMGNLETYWLPAGFGKYKYGDGKSFLKGKKNFPTSVRSYDEGGPVREDGFLTDKEGTPYAKVHKGERVIPGRDEAEGMGLNPEQRLWLRWQSKDISKAQKQAGYLKDLRRLKGIRQGIA